MENNIEYDINIYGNLMITDNEKQSIKVVEVPSIKKLFDEKQRLISFLEDKVKDIKTMYSQINGDYGLMNDKLNAFQEVLDFVRGSKDE